MYFIQSSPTGVERAPSPAAVEIWRNSSRWLFLRRNSHSKAIFLFPKFRIEFSPEIFSFKHRTNLDLRVAWVRIRASFHPLDRFLHGSHLPQPEPGDEFLRFGEWTINYSALRAREIYTLRFRCRMQTFAGQHHARLGQLLVEFSHLG